MVRAWVAVLLAIAVATTVGASLACGATATSDEPNVTMSGTFSASSQIYDTIDKKPVRGSDEYNQLFVKQTEEMNVMVFKPLVPASIIAQVPRFYMSWLRNIVASYVLYSVTGAIGLLKPLVWKRSPGNAPLLKPALEQIVMGYMGIPIITWLPTFAEFIVEKGWTQSYAAIEDVGWGNHVLNIAAYLLFCEFWVYWAHRLLHVPIFYKYLHRQHHQYSKLETVSPCASIAFNPLDGIIQASPLVVALLLIPMHFRTYYIMLFLEEIWSGNIHDTMDAGIFGVLGAGYHNYHHTHFKYNYGHLTIGMDWLFGTLIDPKVGLPQKAGAKALKSS